MDKYERKSDDSHSDISQDDERSYHSAQSEDEAPPMAPPESKFGDKIVILRKPKESTTIKPTTVQEDTNQANFPQNEGSISRGPNRKQYGYYKRPIMQPKRRGRQEQYQKKSDQVQYENVEEKPIPKETQIPENVTYEPINERKPKIVYVKKKPAVPEEKKEEENTGSQDKRGRHYSSYYGRDRRGRARYRRKNYYGRGRNYEETVEDNNGLYEEERAEKNENCGNEAAKNSGEGKSFEPTPSVDSSPPDHLNLKAKPFVPLKSTPKEVSPKFDSKINPSAREFIPKSAPIIAPSISPQVLGTANSPQYVLTTAGVMPVMTRIVYVQAPVQGVVSGQPQYANYGGYAQGNYGYPGTATSYQNPYMSTPYYQQAGFNNSALTAKTPAMCGRDQKK